MSMPAKTLSVADFIATDLAGFGARLHVVEMPGYEMPIDEATGRRKPAIKAPSYPGDVGYDLAANLPTDPIEVEKLIQQHAQSTVWVNPTNPAEWVIAAHSYFDVPVGIAAEIVLDRPLPEGLSVSVAIRPRSSTWRKKRLSVAHGTIDHGYRGAWMFAILNTNPYPVGIRRGEYLAQAVFEFNLTPQIRPATMLSDSQRGAKGFGSSGS